MATRNVKDLGKDLNSDQETRRASQNTRNTTPPQVYPIRRIPFTVAYQLSGQPFVIKLILLCSDGHRLSAFTRYHRVASRLSHKSGHPAHERANEGAAMVDVAELEDELEWVLSASPP